MACIINTSSLLFFPQANVSQSNTQMWNEDERQRVCQSLGGVINHVRLLLIDSQVFAEEVEPTGAVPMEVSLERYRLAALPAKFREQQQQQQQHQLPQQQQQQPISHEDKRLQPRVPTKAFANSQILNRDRVSLQNVLNQWYSSTALTTLSSVTWKLVFRASQYDFSASEFHRICDGLAPLYIIILGPKGEVLYIEVPLLVIENLKEIEIFVSFQRFAEDLLTFPGRSHPPANPS